VVLQVATRFTNSTVPNFCLVPAADRRPSVQRPARPLASTKDTRTTAHYAYLVAITIDSAAVRGGNPSNCEVAIDALVLNAWRAMRLNLDAQVRVVDSAVPLMPRDGRMEFVMPHGGPISRDTWSCLLRTWVFRGDLIRAPCEGVRAATEMIVAPPASNSYRRLGLGNVSVPTVQSR
jgi:hypothetical protein